MADIVRVLRIIEYIGEREAVEKQVAASLHGTIVASGYGGGRRNVGAAEAHNAVNAGKLVITATSVHEFPQMVGERERTLIQSIEILSAELVATRRKLEQTLTSLAEIDV